MATLGLKNVNMLTKEQYDTIAEPVRDELYAISGSGFGFPSDRYENLELGASGTTYTAPANGWVYVRKSNTTVGQYVNVVQGVASSVGFAGLANNYAYVLHPVLKGNFTVNYSAAGTAGQNLRFIYAEGE